MGMKDERHRHSQQYQDRLYRSMDDNMQGEDRKKQIYRCNNRGCGFSTYEEGVGKCPECKTGYVLLCQQKKV